MPSQIPQSSKHLLAHVSTLKRIILPICLWQTLPAMFLWIFSDLQYVILSPVFVLIHGCYNISSMFLVTYKTFSLQEGLEFPCNPRLHTVLAVASNNLGRIAVLLHTCFIYAHRLSQIIWYIAMRYCDKYPMVLRAQIPQTFRCQGAPCSVISWLTGINAWYKSRWESYGIIQRWSLDEIPMAMVVNVIWCHSTAIYSHMGTVCNVPWHYDKN